MNEKQTPSFDLRKVGLAAAGKRGRSGAVQAGATVWRTRSCAHRQTSWGGGGGGGGGLPQSNIPRDSTPGGGGGGVIY